MYKRQTYSYRYWLRRMSGASVTYWPVWFFKRTMQSFNRMHCRRPPHIPRVTRHEFTFSYIIRGIETFSRLTGQDHVRICQPALCSIFGFQISPRKTLSITSYHRDPRDCLEWYGNGTYSLKTVVFALHVYHVLFLTLSLPQPVKISGLKDERTRLQLSLIHI